MKRIWITAMLVGRVTLGVFILCSAIGSYAQTKAKQAVAFDAISIRSNHSLRTIEIAGVTAQVPEGRKPCEYLRDRVICRLPLWAFITEAFQLKEFELSAPQWTKDEMFDLQATMPLDTSMETARRMLQTALEERFGLEYHIVRKTTPVYALVAVQGGPHLMERDPEHPQLRDQKTPSGKQKTNQIVEPGRYFSAGTPLDIFAMNLHNLADLDRPVINKTGLTGRYVIDLQWKSAADREDALHPIDKGIVRAMEEQIGLRLLKEDDELDFMTVDHVNRTPLDL